MLGQQQKANAFHTWIKNLLDTSWITLNRGMVLFFSEKLRTKQEIRTSIQIIANEHKINPELLLAHSGRTIPSHSVASNCLVPLVFLRSREISLMVKSVWKGAICSRRIKRCFIKKSCPSTWVYSTRERTHITRTIKWRASFQCLHFY